MVNARIKDMVRVMFPLSVQRKGVCKLNAQKLLNTFSRAVCHHFTSSQTCPTAPITMIKPNDRPDENSAHK